MEAYNRENTPNLGRLALRGDERSPLKSPYENCKGTVCGACLAFSAYQKRLLKEEKRRW